MQDGCRIIREWLLLDDDGALDARRQEEARAHLGACPDCRRADQAMARTREALQAWKAPAVNPQVSVIFAERLAARVRPSLGQRLFGGWRKAAWTTGLVAGMAVALLSLHGPQAPEQQAGDEDAPAAVVMRGPDPTARTEIETKTAPQVDVPRGGKAESVRKAKDTRRVRQERTAVAATRTGVEVAQRREAQPSAAVPDAATTLTAILAETAALPESAAVIAVTDDMGQEVDPAAVMISLWAETN